MSLKMSHAQYEKKDQKSSKCWPMDTETKKPVSERMNYLQMGLHDEKKKEVTKMTQKVDRATA